jgi:hypothetical protein
MNPTNPGVNSLIYPIVIFTGSLVITMLLLTYAVSSITAAIRKRRAQAIRDWQARGVTFLLGPVQANFLNEPRSFGVGGNGTLVMSDTAIHFAQVTPEREIIIPLKDVERAFLLRRFNGRRGAKPFLIIQRKVGDLTGFQIEDASKWAAVINRIVGAVMPITLPTSAQASEAASAAWSATN